MKKVLLFARQQFYLKQLSTQIGAIEKAKIVAASIAELDLPSLNLKHKPQIIFLEILPNVDKSIGLITKLKTDNSNVKIICLSMISSSIIIEKLLTAGASGVLLKLYNDINLLNEIVSGTGVEPYLSKQIKFTKKIESKPKTIAIVDDFETNVFLLSSGLEQAGYKVLKSTKPKTLLTYFNGQDIDLLISDYRMPKMDGAELVTSIKKIPKYKDLLVLMLSAETEEVKKLLAKEAGAYGWIKKPFNMVRILKIVDNVLKQG